MKVTKTELKKVLDKINKYITMDLSSPLVKKIMEVGPVGKDLNDINSVIGCLKQEGWEVLEEGDKMSKTRCKFVCTKAETLGEGDDKGYTATFDAVCDGSPENEKFFKYTPGGQLSLSVTTVQHFTEGKEYYLDITEVVPVEEDAETKTEY